MNITQTDKLVSRSMHRLSNPAIKVSFAVIFIWFGALKPLGLSAAAPLVLKTVDWMPLFEAEVWLHIIGYWEVLIGVFFLFDKTLRVAILLLFAQMGGTFLPLFILPEITFQEGGIPFLPTLEGQYIIKNLLIIAAALVLGGRISSEPAGLPEVPGQR